MPPPSAPSDVPWVSASDLAEQVYCPRALWYRHHPPDFPASGAAERSAERGARYHARALSAVQRRESIGPALPLALLLLGLLLLVALLLSGAV